MNSNLLKTMMFASKQAFYIFLLQIIGMQLLFANESVSQSLKDVTIFINVEDAELKEVFDVIKSQTDFVFTYNDEVVINSDKITLSRDNVSVKDVLFKLAENSKLQFKRINNNISVIRRTNEETGNLVVEMDREITGNIVEAETGEALIGATVQVKGTTIGTVTDLDGNFTLSIPDDAESLLISYIGFITQEIVVDNRTSFNIKMTLDSETLDEIVVVGYGVQKKSDLTGAVSNAENIQDRGMTSVEEALQGNVAGVTVSSAGGDPTSSPSVTIRGMGTTSNESPLYIVDGVPLPANATNSLNPNDIESMTILKDAASAAIYGFRASGGVILIKTKKGRPGKLNVSFNTFTGVQSVWNKPTALSAAEQSEVYNQAADHAGVARDPIHDASLNPDGQITKTNWVDAIFQRGIIQNYDVGLSGGSENLTFSSSIGYNQKEGTLLNTKAQRLSLRLNTEYKINERLKVGENLSFTRTNGNSVFTGTQTATGGSNFNGIIVNAMAAPPAIPILDENGQYSGIPSPYGDTFNVIAALNRVNVDNPKTNLFGNIYANYELVEGLNIRTSFGANLRNEQYTDFNPRVPEASKIQSDENSLTKATLNQQDWTFENTITYTPELSDDHSLTFLAGNTMQKFSQESYSITGINLPNESANLQYLVNATEFDKPISDKQENSIVSYFGRVNYAFDSKYLLSASIRADGTSKLASDNRWGIFPSVSAGWSVSKEPFLSGISAINDLKVRASWGRLGNISSLGNYATNIPLSETLVILGGSDNYISGFAEDGISNPDLVWETTEQFNYGVDALLFDARVAITMDYFIKNTFDMILPLPITGLAGVSNPPFVNAGQVRNKGLEFALTYLNSDDAPIQYEVTANFSHINNELVKLDGDLTEIIDGTEVRTHGPIQSVVGQPLFSFFLVETDGIFQSQSEIDSYTHEGNLIQAFARPGDLKFKDQNNDGIINEEDRVYKGNAFPEFTYGFNSKISYKNFDLAIFFQGVRGSQAYNGFKFTTLSAAGAGFNLSTEVRDAWSESNTGGTIPVLSTADPNNNQRKSDYFLENSDYLRLKNLAIGYTFSNLKGGKRLRTYVSGQNLLTFTKYTGLDPEVGRLGVDGGQYPVSRAIIFGATLNL